jgi:ankyrin repeat protein
VARLLVEKGADIHTKNICGRTALYLAAEGGYKAVARLLVENR